jgi:hypothetical protein
MTAMKASSFAAAVEIAIWALFMLAQPNWHGPLRSSVCLILIIDDGHHTDHFSIGERFVDPLKLNRLLHADI